MGLLIPPKQDFDFLGFHPPLPVDWKKLNGFAANGRFSLVFPHDQLWTIGKNSH
jgi:hypothetical protein